jgi:hypothetical protein
MKGHLVLIAFMFILIDGFVFGESNLTLATTLNKDVSDSMTFGDDEFYLLSPQHIYLKLVPNVTVPNQTIFFRRNCASWSARISSNNSDSIISIVSPASGDTLANNTDPNNFIESITFRTHILGLPTQRTETITLQSNDRSLLVYVHYESLEESFDAKGVAAHTQQLTFYFNNEVEPNSQTLQISSSASIPWSSNSVVDIALSQTSGQTSWPNSSTTQVSIKPIFFQNLGKYTTSFILRYSITDQYYVEETIGVNVVVSKDKLNVGETLTLGKYLLSQDGQYKLIMQVDGNLVLYRTEDNFVMWASGTNGLGADRCKMQEDGNLVIYDDDGNMPTPIWASVTDGNPGAFLQIENDGKLIVHKSTRDFTPIWSTARLCPGRTLQPNTILRSANGKYKLEMQTDGNLVLRNDFNQIKWASNTYGNPGSRVQMQFDGNLVIRNAGNQIIWASNTYSDFIFRNNSSSLRVEDNGNLVIYKPNNAAIWNHVQGRLY